MLMKFYMLMKYFLVVVIVDNKIWWYRYTRSQQSANESTAAVHKAGF